MRKHILAALTVAVTLTIAVVVSAGASAAVVDRHAAQTNVRGMSPNVAVAPLIIRANEHAAFNYFVGKGLSKKQAAGVVGNLDQESGMDPTIKQYGGGPGHGIAQWSVGGRWDTYRGDNEVHYTNVVLGVSRYNLNGQLKFIWHELRDFSYYGLPPLKSSTTIHGATQVFQDDYEGCGDCNFTARYSYAKDAYNRYA